MTSDIHHNAFNGLNNNILKSVNQKMLSVKSVKHK